MISWFQRQTEQATILDAVAWGVGAVALVIYGLPYLTTACGLLLLRFKAFDDPKLAEPDGTDPEYAERVTELTALGFTPAGLVRERTWLRMGDFHKTFRVRHFRSADGLVFAPVYRIDGKGLLRTQFNSVTPDGCLVQTAMPGVSEPKHEPDYRRTEHAFQPLADLLVEHQTQVADAGGVRPITLAEYAAIDERLSKRWLTDIGNGGTQIIFYIGWLAPYLATVAFFAVVSSQPLVRLLSLGFVVGTVTYPLLCRLLEKLDAGIEETLAAGSTGSEQAEVTANGVAVSELVAGDRSVLTVLLSVDHRHQLPAKLADVRGAFIGRRGGQPDGAALVTVVAPATLWDAVEDGLRTAISGPCVGNLEVRVGIVDGSGGPAREFVLGAADGPAA